MLHKDDDLQNAKAKIPQHVALPVNVRKVDTLSLGENCVHKEICLVNLLRKEEEKNDSSILANGGQFCVIFTSYDENPSPNTNTCQMNVMQSTSMNEVSNFHATHLTEEIINQGIKWLRGSSYAEKDFGSVADALQEYLNALKEVIPLQNPSELSLNHASKFIDSREWSDDSQKDKTLVLDCIEKYSRMESNSELSKACCLARRFIYKYLAKQTKIVAHVLDGIHRLTALECLLIGYQQPDTDNYAVRLPHAGTNLPITSMVPPELDLESKDFLDDMKKISSECQQSFGSLQPHSKKVFFAAMILHLNEQIKLNRGWRKIQFFMTTKPVDKQIEHFAKLIIKVICDKKHVENNYRMVPNMNLETLVEEKDEDSWTNLFKTNKNGQFSFLWDDKKLTLVNFIHCHSDIFNKNRYARDGFNAEVFELVQVLLWSRISQETYHQLLNFFTTNRVSSTVTQISASDKNGKMTDRWVSGFVDSVTTSVYYSYKIITEGKNSSKDSEILLMELIKSAIKGTTDFFSEYGLHPSPPDWFKNVQEKMEDKSLIVTAIQDVLDSKGKFDKDVNAIYDAKDPKYMNSLQDDFVAFLRTAFAIYLDFRILNKTRGRSNLKTKHDSLKEKRTVIVAEDTNQTWTACITEYASRFAEVEFSGERLEGNILLMTRHFVGSKGYTAFMKAKKFNKPVEGEVITTPEHQVMEKFMTSIQSLQEKEFPSYVQTLINNNTFDEKTKEKAETLVELFQKLSNNDRDESKSQDGDSGVDDNFF